MLFLQLNCQFKTLEVQAAVNVLLPHPEEILRKRKKPIPTLYLLHGLSDDHTGWMRYSSVEQYAQDYYVAVVMPAVNRSFYTDMAHGARYFSYVSQELPAAMETLFPLATCRERRFVAGLSMGGYGALKIGLSLPERYAAAASLSGALDLRPAFQPMKSSPTSPEEMCDVFGSEQVFSDGNNNLWNLAKGLAPDRVPRLYVSCGTEDELFSANEHFVRDFGKQLSIEYSTFPGNHTWDVWDREIKRVLAWLPLEKAERAW
ncbi:MAG: esterase family protein [Clostridia bacterium]|nr:esterase family protein [Clostridia bacterium]